MYIVLKFVKHLSHKMKNEQNLNKIKNNAKLMSTFPPLSNKMYFWLIIGEQ